MEFYSQFNQDKFLYENFFKNKENGFFLDIGAHDGITGNNTFLFEKLGWSGVCIEPIPSVFEKLKNNRNCILVESALSGVSGEEDFLVLEGYTEMLSGIVKNYDPRHLTRIENELRSMGGKKEIIRCKTITMDELNLPSVIDYVSLDVEGSELNILKTIDFNKYQINFMSIENNYNDINITNIMLENSFEIISYLGCDTIFKNKKIC
jgi:FkbM family methyltransferase